MRNEPTPFVVIVVIMAVIAVVFWLAGNLIILGVLLNWGVSGNG